uniref:Uncharacterized protein n=1 Tax=Attheya septentrionalis TaxID=420275 RepID=A0A7S2UCM5_9STRA|mmetsp:Transcript_19792/g.35928  ORF Transcript_19792/g.35928 Transcript_19792/m.35928 type:complete len:622 (+) Transcript_19792:143-2008(+)
MTICISHDDGGRPPKQRRRVLACLLVVSFLGAGDASFVTSSRHMKRERRRPDNAGRSGIPNHFPVSFDSYQATISTARHENNLNYDENQTDGDSLLKDEIHMSQQHSWRMERRDMLRWGASTLLLGSIMTTTTTRNSMANAMGLIRFPCTEGLGNTYHFLRAGESLLEAQNVWSTNPLFLTNREAALSDHGMEQVKEACGRFETEKIVPTVVRYSLAANAVDTANIVGRDLKIGRDRLVPEFNFMDPRALGKYDFLPRDETEAAIWALDADEAGEYGTGGRPPPNEDGTPDETLSDQVIRLRQLMSVLETQYSGDTILLIFPDSTGPALLMALIGGIPLNRVHELNMEAGETRFNVTMQRALNDFLVTDTKTTTHYKETLERGRQTLKELRNDPDSIVNVKDQQYEVERIEDEETQRKKEEIETGRLAEEQAKREQTQKLAEDQKQQREKEKAAATANIPQGSSSGNAFDVAIPSLLASVGVVGAALAAMGGSNNKNETSIDTLPEMPESKEPNIPLENMTSRLSIPDVDSDLIENNTRENLLNNDDMKREETSSSTTATIAQEEVRKIPPLDPRQVAQDAMDEYLDADDGAGAWFGMLSDLVEDEEDSIIMDEDETSSFE